MSKFSKLFCTFLVTVLFSLACSTLVVTAADLSVTTSVSDHVVTINGPAYDDDEVQ